MIPGAMRRAIESRHFVAKFGMITFKQLVSITTNCWAIIKPSLLGRKQSAKSRTLSFNDSYANQ